MIIRTCVQNSLVKICTIFFIAHNSGKMVPEFLAFQKNERVLRKVWIFFCDTKVFNFSSDSISPEISNEIGFFFAALFYSPQVICKTLWRDCDSGRCPNFPKIDLDGGAGEGEYIRQEPFAKMTFFKVYLKCFLMEQSRSRIIWRFSWAIQIGCRKLYLKIRKT